ncbi:MAG TPA: alkaline phosphatase family protein [Candidatus Limiplasma sp.]|mgnify:CR=1 FL=1|nr:alkaline phosphatase family protein [Candidatus Limiplasma sp.]HRX07777.1 alkaline phosphatase family protein [Candidatus Limiplasma sp.]
MHKTGCRSEQTRESIRVIDKSVQDLCESLTDTLVIVIADHGHIDVRYHVITDSPEIHSMLKRPISVENRAAAFYIKDECKRQFPEGFKQTYGDEFLLLSQDEVLSSGLFGSGTRNSRLLESVGDFLAIAVSDTALAYSHESKQHVSTHAGLTDAEMRVPLILIEKPAM